MGRVVDGEGGGPSVSWKWVIVVGILLVLLQKDPLRLSIISKHPHFHPNRGSLTPWEGETIPRDPRNRLQQAEIIHTTDFVGPESMAFDLQGGGPYTGVSDGRIVKWNGPKLGWTDFAYTSPNWSRACISAAPTAPNTTFEHICGRPLGLRFNKTTGDLFIADAYFGLMVVGPNGGFAKSLSSQAEGIPFKFTNDLDMDTAGFIYFTDSSSRYERRQFALVAFEWDISGRLLRYDTRTKQTKVLLGGLSCPNGVSLNKDESFLVVAEANRASLLRYWLKGPKAGTVDLFAAAVGHPDNIRINDNGDFWVAMHIRRSLLLKLLSPRPWLRNILANLPIPLLEIHARVLMSRPQAMVVRYSEDGEVLEVLEDGRGEVVKLPSEAEEKDGKLWVGSALFPQIAVFDLSH